MAEWLGTGLQNQVQQFDSAWYLKTKELTVVSSFVLGTVSPIVAAAELSGRSFQFQELQFPVEAGSVAGEASVSTDYPVAGNDD